MKGLRIPALLASVLLLVPPACEFTAEEGTSDSWKRYTASDSSFAVDYPENFEPFELSGADVDPEGEVFQPNDLAGVLFANERPSAVGGVAIGLLGGEWQGTELRLGVARLAGGAGPDLDTLAEVLRESNRAIVGYEELHFHETSIRGVPGYDYAYQASGTTPDGRVVEQAIRLVFLQDAGAFYVVSGGALLETFEEETEVIDRFITSFEVL